ncbi:lipoprotein insertase outer membrane protein LolB [Marinospirillum alkaliphilum]|uniref:Outer-membrane lipoprotein LolB n=1 Tax=Marinospirillum alkaliphilum DSM 21637 TaxID=1122209 RepID=A0A1K1YXV0_9GAMM|nr:lipoprotein insertase outer membrane protein LolB [Marinospirillum alkaliphilum]SFX66631.1 outer membrane lipoprotein LolB [Marinospirillum alkaliphilum DSM 21637]
MKLKMPAASRLLPVFLLSLLLGLSGCASKSLIIPDNTSLEPNAELWHWRAQGRIAVNDGRGSHSASLDWQQQGYHYQLQILGPLGQGSARLEGQPFLVSLVTSDGQLLQAASPEQLMQQGLGWSFPLSNLIYWMRGLPAPGQVLVLDDQRIQQNGWQIEWRRFSEVDGYQLPSLLIAENGNMQLRLSVSAWQLLPEQ